MENTIHLPMKTISDSRLRNRSGDIVRKLKIDSNKKRKGEIRGYKVKSLPPQCESAWARRHNLLQIHSELQNTGGALALCVSASQARCLRREEWTEGVTRGDPEKKLDVGERFVDICVSVLDRTPRHITIVYSCIHPTVHSSSRYASMQIQI